MPGTRETGARSRNESATAGYLGRHAAGRGLLKACADRDCAGLAMVVGGTTEPCRQRAAVVGAGLRTAAVRCRLGDSGLARDWHRAGLRRIENAAMACAASRCAQ